jgi:hypothetical protein
MGIPELPQRPAWLSGAPRPKLTLPVMEERCNSYDLAVEAASCCGIREGETLAEFIRRLHDETLADRDDT